jgi:hypothetical protein
VAQQVIQAKAQNVVYGHSSAAAAGIGTLLQLHYVSADRTQQAHATVGLREEVLWTPYVTGTLEPIAPFDAVTIYYTSGTVRRVHAEHGKCAALRCDGRPWRCLQWVQSGPMGQLAVTCNGSSRNGPDSETVVLRTDNSDACVFLSMLLGQTILRYRSCLATSFPQGVMKAKASTKNISRAAGPGHRDPVRYRATVRTNVSALTFAPTPGP